MPDQSDNPTPNVEDSNSKRAPETRHTEKPMKDLLEIRERLGFGLRSMYRSVLEEPLPDDMVALLDQLNENDDSSSKSSTDPRG
ncbi:NepR family anti-sigma factor [Parasphingorhabdus sp.]|uniref:NepR family anti-sigma factor n=1 Tax=Parasphingorhabdus sp. TaxID=2709688 RepID=UPI002F94BF1A